MIQEPQTPLGIEEESMRRIQAELDRRGLLVPEEHAAVVRRAIHATADFDYAENLRFTPGAAAAGVAALQSGTPLFTGTNMARAGVSQAACRKLGVECRCYMADPETAQLALDRGTTRAAAAADRWAQDAPQAVFAVGNAPTALMRMAELIEAGALRPALVIGVPVGFVHVVESKERIWSVCRAREIPAVVAMGRKGGSAVAAAICNALLYAAAGMR